MPQTATFTPEQPMSQQELGAYLASVPFFEGLAPELLADIAAYATEVKIRPQYKVFRQDSDADAFYVVAEGEVAIEVPSVDGEPALVQHITPHQVLGWSWVVPPYRWHFDARATKATRLIRLDGKRLRERCEEQPRLGFELLKRAAALMMKRLEAARLRLIELHTGL